jgi:hypothetical protein
VLYYNSRIQVCQHPTLLKTSFFFSQAVSPAASIIQAQISNALSSPNSRSYSPPPLSSRTAPLSLSTRTPASASTPSLASTPASAAAPQARTLSKLARRKALQTAAVAIKDEDEFLSVSSSAHREEEEMSEKVREECSEVATYRFTCTYMIIISLCYCHHHFSQVPLSHVM